MGKKKSQVPYEFQHESMQDPESVIHYLEALSEGFRAGRLLFCWGKNEMVLKPQSLLDFGVKARRKDGRVKVTLRIAWKEPGEEDDREEPLIIRPIDEEDE